MSPTDPRCAGAALTRPQRPGQQSSHPDRLLADILQWDVRSWSRAVRFWEQRLDWSRVQDCLELGGREGGLSLWMALRGKRVVCSDLRQARATAAPLHERYAVQGLVEYRDLDATALPYESQFDLIAFKSILGGIGRDGHPERQRQALAECCRALRPGGRLVLAENLQASPLHRWARRRFVPWGGSWRYLTEDELRQYLRPFAAVEIRTTGFLAAFGRGEGQRRLLAAADAVLGPVVPAGWRYIGCAVAVR